MQTPRPDRFTYPPHGPTDDDVRPGDLPGGDWKKPWMRTVFIGGLLGALLLGLIVGFAY